MSHDDGMIVTWQSGDEQETMVASYQVAISEKQVLQTLTGFLEDGRILEWEVQVWQKMWLERGMLHYALWCALLPTYVAHTHQSTSH